LVRSTLQPRIGRDQHRHIGEVPAMAISLAVRKFPAEEIKTLDARP
jgi:hypothetical protein